MDDHSLGHTQEPGTAQEPDEALGTGDTSQAPDGVPEPGVAPDVSGAQGPATVCAVCGAPVFAENNFCEACGHRVSAPASGAQTASRPASAGPASHESAPGGGTAAGGCTGCGGTAIDVDGYCERCGLRQPGGTDHLEFELTASGGGVLAAGVTDRGLRHSKNEDAMASAAAPGGVAVVVCDGVSSSPRPENASRAAADTGVSVLVKELEAGTDAETATRRAALRAAQAVAALAASEYDAPACTYVSALVRDGSVTVGWVGDSRAYWLPAAPTGERTGPPTGPIADQPVRHADQATDQLAEQLADQATDPPADGPAGQATGPGGLTGSGGGVRLTEDDSWAEQMVALGVLSQAEAHAHRNAHVLVGWLGADAEAVQAHVRTLRPEGPGVVVLCSDGLWNYLPAASAIAGALGEALPGPPAGVGAAVLGPLAAARSLVGVALDSGGRDNVTVTVIPFLPAGLPDPAGPAGPVASPAQPSTEPAE